MSASAFGASAARTHTTDGPADPYDHAISLIDTTVPKDAETEPRTRTPSPGWRKLVKKPTKGSMMDQLARRKYAKYQQGKYGSKEGSIVNAEDEASDVSAKPKDSIEPIPNGQPDDGHETDATVLAQQEQEPHRGRQGKHHNKHGRRREPPYEVDILYENQRGWFFFGIPLYSHSSLLNFDPSPWVTKDLKDSAVDITNAQVPDPSWVWSWKSWYVDMSYDVDEQGWQYSFSFSRKFTWHGTHPWFHSFVRRRRWLRKRVKRHDSLGYEKARTLGAGHQLTGDYFTIHPAREKSPGSFVDPAVKAARPESYISNKTSGTFEEPPEDVKNIPSLMRALRFAKIDREKIELVKRFVEEGGDELTYLREKIPEIMSFLVFQNSRRQLLVFLQKAAQDARKHREDHDAEERPEGDAEGRRIDNLLSAVEAADVEVRGLEYWSDRKHVLNTTDDAKSSHEPSRGSSRGRQSLDNNPVDNIKGIPEDAEVKEDQAKHLIGPEVEEKDPTPAEKGKGKAVEEEDGEQEHEKGNAVEEPPRLKFDSVLIPDADSADGGH